MDDTLKEMDTYTGIYGFAILVLCGFILSLIRSIHFFAIFLKASIRLHDKMFQAVVRSPLLFFNRNPIGIPTFKFYRVIPLKNRNINKFYAFIGRILNRFSKDIGCIDDLLPLTLFIVISVIKASNLWQYSFGKQK